MPRQRRGAAPPARSGGARPVAAPPKTAMQPAQSRAASTTAYPPATATRPQPPAAQAQPQQQSPGLFGQMASTAAGVAVGSSIGHAIGGLFSGGGSSAPAADAGQTNAVAPNSQSSTYNSSGNLGENACEMDMKQFTNCMNESRGDMQTCGWYLEQFKACQAASRQY